ncbi:MAG: 16S rRNA (adenine(1518)-N(6)/adenine(1519)-N(6))-dimethyltransferase RsmA [bacterium]|nr:16S rRNA (adenine(1518)-N(6)/adenine(1519)-N(6))-dimethyltransferase RsmA [bacterium]
MQVAATDHGAERIPHGKLKVGGKMSNINLGQKSQTKSNKSSRAKSKGPNKSLGQHWLRDREILNQIAIEAEISEGDFVLEIGPGLGTLTSSLLHATGKSGKVLAVEFDPNLAKNLPGQFPGKNITVINTDFLDFDLNQLPKNYKVAANVPYYITSKIIEKLLTSTNKPQVAALLVQKEVADRICAPAGELSVLGIAAQLYAETKLGIFVSRELFTPPPKVDSQVVILKILEKNKLELFNEKNNLKINEKQFFRVVKAGFAARRKKISKALSANLAISKDQTIRILSQANVSPDIRAQDISIEEWLAITKYFIDYS